MEPKCKALKAKGNTMSFIKTFRYESSQQKFVRPKNDLTTQSNNKRFA